MDQDRLYFICDGLDWDLVTEEECGILLAARDDERIDRIYEEKRSGAWERKQFQARRQAHRLQVRKNCDWISGKAGIDSR